MKTFLLASFGAFAASVYAQEAFESPKFNATEALIANGVNVSAIPDLAAASKKYSLSRPCAAAVSHAILISQGQSLTCDKVRLPGNHLWRKGPHHRVRPVRRIQ